MVTRELVVEDANFRVWLVNTIDADGNVVDQQRVTEAKAGTTAGNEVVWRAYAADQVAMLRNQMAAVAAEAARLRDPSVTFTVQQLRNDLASLGDSLNRVTQALIGVGKVAMADYLDQPVTTRPVSQTAGMPIDSR